MAQRRPPGIRRQRRQRRQRPRKQCAAIREKSSIIAARER
jgi:hypothetical protein